MRTLAVVIALVGCLGACGGGGDEGSTPSLGRTTGALTAAADPCDFSGAPAFGYDQVLACYRSVPFCSDKADPVLCDRDAQVAHLREAIEGFSDLRDTYDAKYHWRAQLDAISRTTFASDYDQFVAFGELFANFRSDHWTYYGPSCFEEVLFELIPINFGSAFAKVGPHHDLEQIIYLRQAHAEGAGGFDLSGYSSFYKSTTGIDVGPLVGQRVVSINGQAPLHFFREWGKKSLRQDDNDGINLMSILDEAGYTLRSGSFNPFPESRSITLVLETSQGVRSTIELPWIFIPFAALGYGTPLPASSQEFRDVCFQPAAAPAGAAPSVAAVRERRAVSERNLKRRAHVDAVTARLGHAAPLRGHADFSEVPPDQLGKDITEIFPLSDGARSVAYLDDTVAFQIRSSFLEPWDEELDAGARYACDHAQRLIVDMRGNLGGYISRAERLGHYLQNVPSVFPSAIFPYRELAESPALNEFRQLSEQLVPLGYPACYAGFEAACNLDARTGHPITDPSWYKNVFLEYRGKAVEELTPQVTYDSQLDPSFVIPCAGKFKGKNLIVLLNGLNSSAAFFAPELLRKAGTIVVTGGLAGEPMTTGRARGGPVLETSDFVETADLLHDALGQTVQHALPALPRPVAFHLEYDAFYEADRKDLYVDHPPVGEIQVPFWSNTLDTDGAAYRAVVSAVERRALIEPVCGGAERARSCELYGHCARAALLRAENRDAITATTAQRVLEDSVAACRRF